MPLYDYLCQHCGPFDAMRSIAQGAQAPCPGCGHQAARAWLHAPMLSGLNAQKRQALATNERAQNEPRSSGDGDSYQRLGHAANCGCCRPLMGRASKATQGVARTAGQRPWMLSH